MRRLVGTIAEAVILFLCFLLGRRMDRGQATWLDGPTGPRRIGTDFHRSLATEAGLEVKTGRDIGLLPDCGALDGDGFDSSRLHPSVRDFYEHTARYHLDVWSQWSPLFWPFGWALIHFVSRRMEQLNFPMYPLETAQGMILLRPEANSDGSLKLISSGRRFGDPGFYRITATGPTRLRVWYVRGLTELFHVYPDGDGSVRTDHDVRWWGMPVLRLHYHITLGPAGRAAGASEPPAYTPVRP